MLSERFGSHKSDANIIVDIGLVLQEMLIVQCELQSSGALIKVFVSTMSPCA